jgi:hypothetical protein
VSSQASGTLAPAPTQMMRATTQSAANTAVIHIGTGLRSSARFSAKPASANMSTVSTRFAGMVGTEMGSS